MKKRLNIGLAVPYVDNEFTASIISGALLAAEKHDVNLFVISNLNILMKSVQNININLLQCFRILHPKALTVLL